MDELMRHQPTLKSATMQAIQRLLDELHTLGSDPSTICSRYGRSSDPTDFAAKHVVRSLLLCLCIVCLFFGEITVKN